MIAPPDVNKRPSVVPEDPTDYYREQPFGKPRFHGHFEGVSP